MRAIKAEGFMRVANIVPCCHSNVGDFFTPPPFQKDYHFYGENIITTRCID
jgi:hypothetical protein